jgi:hypothetical protein
MEIENKYEEDLVILNKEPETGDLVQYRHQPLGADLGVVMQTWHTVEEYGLQDMAHVMWDINDHEDETSLDLQVVSSANEFYD